MQFYTDRKRESDEHALPDAEVFYMSAADIAADEWVDGDGEAMEPGWYYWYGFPGCLPDSDPFGPFATEDEAIQDARESAGIE